MSHPPFARAVRRPRFRRAAEPPPFRLTDGDVEIVRHLAVHRFLQSTHIAALVGRSLDRVNDRLLRLFHAGYVDRPRAQLDYYPDRGSAPMVYALADRGARLLAERGEPIETADHTRKNREAGRPFIEHQLAVMDFYVSLQLALRMRPDPVLLHPADLIAAFPQPPMAGRHPFALQARLTQAGTAHDVTVIPDLAFGIRFEDGSRRCFLVEIDRGTMPVTRSHIRQTSFARKMYAYLTAHAQGLHERQFGWRTFRVLIATTEAARLESMIGSLRSIPAAARPGAALFLFALLGDFSNRNLLCHPWQDYTNRRVYIA
jgi:hypothetical protein